MGVVYEATQLSLDRAVALKVLAAGLASDGRARARFVQEGRLAARVSHPNLLTVLDVAEVSGRLVLAHELVVGETLQRRLEREGALSVELSLQVALAVAGVLATLHAAGVLHRDLKPANLFLSSDRGVLVGDLGIAKDLLSGGFKTAAGLLLGTPLYMAPETWAGAPATAATDLYAAGLLLFECLTGRPPFVSEDPLELSGLHSRAPVPRAASCRSDLPAGFDELLCRALAKDPRDRFPDAATFERALRALPTARTAVPKTRAVAVVAGRAARRAAVQPAAVAQTRLALDLPAPGSRRTAAIAGAVALALVAAALALRPVPNSAPPPAVAPLRARPAAKPAPDTPAAWLASPSLPGDEELPELAQAQQSLRAAREEVNRVHSKLRGELGHLDLSHVVRKTAAIWAGPLGGCRKALERMRDGIQRGEPATVERGARLLGSLLVVCCEMQDCFGWTARSWLARPERRADVAAEIQVGIHALRLKEALARVALPLHESLQTVLPGPDAVPWRAGVACWMSLVDSALPRGRDRPSPSDLLRKALLETVTSSRGTELLLVRALSRAVRQVCDPPTALRTLEEALAVLRKARPSPAPDAALAEFDLRWQHNWATHELVASPGSDSAEERRRERKAWQDMLSRLLEQWPFDPREAVPTSTSGGSEALAASLVPDVKARLADVGGWIANVSKDLERDRQRAVSR
jgi:hypothetical protein